MAYKSGTKEYRQQYYLDHKQEIIDRSSKRYQENTEEILRQRRDRELLT